MYRSNGNWSTPEPIDTSGYTSTASASIAGCHLAADPQEGFHLTYSAQFTSDQDGLFYRRVIPGSGDKRYYAGGQLLATRVDGTLYYGLNDPTGTSFTVTDDTGGFVGRIVYDGYGAELVNTLPTVLGQTLPGAADAATGLVHQGNGRYYDPRLGRPLQPNLASTPPTVPQSLNRYTATSIGQPGVYAAAETKWNPFADDFISNPFKAVLSGSYFEEGITWGLESYVHASLRSTTEYFWELAPKRVPKFPFIDNVVDYVKNGVNWLPRQLGGPFEQLLDYVRNKNSRYVNEWVYRGYNTITSHYLPAGRITEKFLASAGGQLALEGIIGFSVDVGYQVLLDIGNPYLSGAQIAKRALLGQGSGSLASFALGFGAKQLATAWFGASVGGPVGFVVGVGVSIVWDIYGAPLIYKAFDSEPVRDLALLTGP